MTAVGKLPKFNMSSALPMKDDLLNTAVVAWVAGLDVVVSWAAVVVLGGEFVEDFFKTMTYPGRLLVGLGELLI